MSEKEYSMRDGYEALQFKLDFLSDGFEADDLPLFQSVDFLFVLK